jgi:SAM-dependent methyltransferase
VSVRFDLGFADALGYGEARFDRVFSSMMFHHLGASEKHKTLREIHRVLKREGRLELLDFAGPRSAGHGLLTRLIHSHRQLRDNAEGRVLAMMDEAGLAARRTGQASTIFGEVVFYQAARRSTEVQHGASTPRRFSG